MHVNTHGAHGSMPTLLFPPFPPPMHLMRPGSIMWDKAGAGISLTFLRGPRDDHPLHMYTHAHLIPPGTITWDKVAGLHQVKMLLQEVTVLPSLRPDLFMGIRQPPRGILLFGPPGSGKTLLARAVATESRSSFIPITGVRWRGTCGHGARGLR